MDEAKYMDAARIILQVKCAVCICIKVNRMRHDGIIGIVREHDSFTLILCFRPYSCQEVRNLQEVLLSLSIDSFQCFYAVFKHLTRMYLRNSGV